MMQQMRDNMKLVIWITAIVFMVGFGVLQLGGVLNPQQQQGPTGVIAEINGEALRYDEFMRVYQGMVQQLQRERPLQEGEDSYIREQTWQQILRERLLRQEVKRRGITVTPEEIKAAVRFAPPSVLAQAPIFQTNGQFDYRKYQQELDNPNSQVPWNEVEAMVADQLPLQKLQNLVTEGAKVSEGDVRDRFLLQQEKLDLQVLRFAPESFPVDTGKVGGADIEAYYKAHPDEFTRPAEVNLAVGLVRRMPGDADFAATRERMQGILDQVRALPDSFPRYARTYSEIGSAQRGGDVPGEPLLKEMRPAFRAALEKVQEGQVSEIVREERSMHIFKIEKRFPDPKTGEPRIHYREIALRVNPGPEAIQKARDQVDAFIKAARAEGITKAATRMGIMTTMSGFFREGRSQNEVFQRFPEVETWAFSAKQGSISRPIPHENGWYVYQIAERRPAGRRPLEQVADEAKAGVLRALATERAKAAAEEARAAIVAGMAPEQAAAKFGGTVAEAQGVTRNGYMNAVGRDPEAVGEFMTLADRTWSRVIDGPSGALLAQVLKHERPSEEEFKKQEASVRENLLAERRQVLFYEWMNALRKKAKIVDYRENFFEV